MQGAVAEQTSEIDRLVTTYLGDAGGDPHRALRLAIADLLQVSIDARLTELELRRGISVGFLRQPPLNRAA